MAISSALSVSTASQNTDLKTAIIAIDTYTCASGEELVERCDNVFKGIVTNISYELSGGEQDKIYRICAIYEIVPIWVYKGEGLKPRKLKVSYGCDTKHLSYEEKVLLKDFDCQDGYIAEFSGSENFQKPIKGKVYTFFSYNGTDGFEVPANPFQFAFSPDTKVNPANPLEYKDVLGAIRNCKF